ncbi:MAG: bifunctional enoyl-CoA hydratase/phosphate acetyltransferase [Proteobacteria bacterium]|nr:bifunctional enoyl-CoA hydratase/phosphate acetyltransferase [Pseudomonadota bacterium]
MKTRHLHPRYDSLIAACRGLPPLRTAVVFPCDRLSLEGALEATRAGLIEPVLLGPDAQIRFLAHQLHWDLHTVTIMDVPEARAAAAQAITLARGGEVEALMKGSLHTDDLMAEVVKAQGGIRTGRRISHVFVMDVPSYSKLLLITDAAVNITPTLEEKADIVQNAIDLAHSLGVNRPKVAILSALETVTPRIPSTIEAAALCKMADRHQITGGILDGPLALDNAISRESAAVKHIDSPVAGDADILVVPDMEAGNMLAKELSYLAGADAAGIVLGAQVPIVLTSRADNPRARLASCAVATLYGRFTRKPSISFSAASQSSSALPTAGTRRKERK